MKSSRTKVTARSRNWDKMKRRVTSSKWERMGPFKSVSVSLSRRELVDWRSAFVKGEIIDESDEKESIASKAKYRLLSSRVKRIDLDAREDPSPSYNKTLNCKWLLVFFEGVDVPMVWWVLLDQYPWQLFLRIDPYVHGSISESSIMKEKIHYNIMKSNMIIMNMTSNMLPKRPTSMGRCYMTCIA